MRHIRAITCVILISILASAAGCGGNLFPVEGQVRFKGGGDISKLEGAVVLFEPLDVAANATSSRGYIRPDGRYTMGTLGDADGVAPGSYKVLVLPPPIPNPERPPPGWPPLKESFSRMDQSPFTFAVEQKRNTFDMEVE